MCCRSAHDETLEEGNCVEISIGFALMRVQKLS
jgi:hypothetical protein